MPLGLPFNFTVVAEDSFGNTTPTYTGTVHFSSSDSSSSLPPDFTFNAGDAGVHVFTATLNTTGPQTLTATDVNTNSITGSTTVNVVVNSTTLSVTAPASTIAGNAFNFTVEALDGSLHVLPSYTGTVHFSSTDPISALPVDYTFTAADAGIHVFTTGILKTAGTQTLTATDTSFATATGSTTILVTPAAATHYSVVAPTAITARYCVHFHGDGAGPVRQHRHGLHRHRWFHHLRSARDAARRADADQRRGATLQPP